MAESAGLLFKIKGDASDAVRAFNQVDREASTLTGTTSGLASTFSSLAAPAAIAGAAVAAIGVAALAGARAIYDLTKSTAEFGSTIFDASQKTGLGAETLSALKFAAEQAGSSFEEVTKGVVTFQVELGKATQGSEKAAAKMELLGVTSTDTRTALAQAVKTIYDAKDANERAALAAAAFGKRIGPELIPLIIDAKGNLDQLERTAKALGVTITDDAAKAADEFGDQLDTLNEQVADVGRTIGFAFMPAFTDMAKGLSDFLTRNQDEIKAWGDKTSLTLQGLILQFKELKKAADDYYLSAALGAAGRWNPAYQVGQMIGADARARAIAAQPKITSVADLRMSDDTNRLPASPSLDQTGGGTSAAAKSALDLAKRDLAAGMALASDLLKDLNSEFARKLESMSKQFHLSGDREAFQKDVQALIEWYNTAWLEADGALIKIEEDQARRRKATKNELLLLQDQQTDRQLEMTYRLSDARDKAATLERDQSEKTAKKVIADREKIEEQDKEIWEARMKRAEEEAAGAQAAYELEQKRIEARREALGLDQSIGFTGIEPLLNPEGPNIFDQLADSWEHFFAQINEGAPILQTVMGMLQNAFQGMANAIGNVVQNWVLYGETGPAVMRKVVAAALASIAAEAAVRAIYATAYGFLMLALGDFYSAGQAFIAAAVFGTIAVGAALAGRAVAGSAFRQQTAQATGATGTNRQGSRPTGGAYSSEKDQTMTAGINQPAIRGEISVKLGLDADGVLTFLEQDASNNGRFRGLVLRLANA